MRHNMSSLTTTHEMNDQSKTEIRQVSQFLVHPHPPDRFHIHYFFYIAFRSDPMRNTQSQFLLVLPLKSPRADKNPGFPLLAVPHMWNPACAGNTGHKQRERHPRGGRTRWPERCRHRFQSTLSVRRATRLLRFGGLGVLRTLSPAAVGRCRWWLRRSLLLLLPPCSGAVSGGCGTRTRDVSVSEIYRLLPSPLGQPTKSVIGYTKIGVLCGVEITRNERRGRSQLFYFNLISENPSPSKMKSLRIFHSRSLYFSNWCTSLSLRFAWPRSMTKQSLTTS